MQQAQQALDRLAVEIAQQRLERQAERLAGTGDYGLHKPVRAAVEEVLPRVASEISRILTGATNGQGGGKTSPAVVVLRKVPAEALAAIALHETLAAVARRKSSLVAVLRAMGSTVGLYVWHEGLAEKDQRLAERLFKLAAAGRDRRDRARRLAFLAANAGLEPPEPDPILALRMGAVLLRALQAADVVSLWYPSDQESETEVVLTDAFGVILAATEANTSWLQPAYLPLLAPPPRWKDPGQGPYVLRTGRPLHLVRGRPPQAYRKAMESGQLEPVVRALDIVGSTAWRIDREMFELVRWAVSEGGFPDTPTIHLLPLPEAPEGWRETWSEDQIRAHKRKRRDVRQENNRIKGELLRFRQVEAAIDALGNRVFYIPHNLDFRGRLYPVCAPNFQMAGWVRACLRFATPRELGEGGERWLRIHLANTFGLDKRPLRERLGWAEDNREMFARVAADPRNNREWTEADEPWLFLAAAREWADMEAWRAVHGTAETFPSTLPTSVDASNSGLQHYAAMMRSRSDGRLVNLLPGDPQDVYAAVANEVRKLVEEDLRTTADELERTLAEKWLAFGITRAIVKRSVMTFPYSSKAYGFKQQLLEDLMAPLQTKVVMGELPEHPLEVEGDRGRRAAGYLARQIWVAVNRVIADAGRAMEYLQKLAGALAHAGLPTCWTTPTGLPVEHRYCEVNVTRIAVPLAHGAYSYKSGGDGEETRVHKVSLGQPTERLNKSKQKSAIAPNVIHSMDAAHMVMVLNKGADLGITNWGVVHDSWAVPAGDMDALFYVLRSTFVELYESYDPLQVLHATATAMLDDKGRRRLPQPPVRGDLDLREVLQSLYCFS